MGIWGILPVLSGITVFTQGNLQSEKITTLTVEEEEDTFWLKCKINYSTYLKYLEVIF